MGLSSGPVARVILITMSLSITLTVLLGAALLPGLSWPLLLLVVCIVIPSNFTAVERVARDTGLPTPVHGALNIENGDNDGLGLPVFIFALVLAHTDNEQNTAEDASRRHYPSPSGQ